MPSSGWIRHKLDEDTVTRMYLEDKLSGQKIARELGVSGQTIGRLLNDLGVRKRNRVEVNKTSWSQRVYPEVSINERQDQIIVGTLLGDGHVGTQASSVNPTFSVAHKELDKEYTLWKYNELESTGLFRNPPFPRKKRFEDGREFIRLGIRSLQHPILKEYRNLIYHGDKKVITLKVLERCNLLGLAVYYMDDGGLRREEWYYPEEPKVPCFYTYSYTQEEVVLLRYFLDSRWGIKAELKEIKYGTPRRPGRLLLVLEKSLPRFRELIVPYILPITCMHRKIP